MTNRQTSNYTLRVTHAAGDATRALTELAESATVIVGVITDQHSANTFLNTVACVGFRAADDEEAAQQAREIRAAYAVLSGREDGRWDLTTGYGVHRRAVTPQAVS